MTQDIELAPVDVGHLTKVVEHIGTGDFPGHFCHLCAGLAGADAAYLAAFFDSSRPAEIYSTHGDPETMEALALYLEVAFVLDPFYHLFQSKSGDSVKGLNEVAPDDFRRSEYYAKFFQTMNLGDECGVMLHVSDDAALFLSLGVSGGDQMRITRLKAFLPVIGSLARRHWTVLTPDRFDGTGRLAAQLDQAFGAFGNSVLSPREGEITRMILRGHSTKAIARAFNNSPETVKVHRKRIHSKLGVASQGELLSLFLEALRRMPTTAKGDPLVFLDG